MAQHGANVLNFALANFWYDSLIHAAKRAHVVEFLPANHRNTRHTQD